MSPARKPSLILPVAVAALLLAGYVGAYYSLARPEELGPLTGPRPPRVPAYNFPFRGEWSWVKLVFAPIHWLDRRIRPHVWELPE